MTPEELQNELDWHGTEGVVETINKAVAEERERKWISFKDRQPKYESVVLVTANGQAATIQYLGENWHWTHWMPYANPEESA